MASTRGPDQTVRLTKKLVESLAPPVGGQAFHRDADLPGFALRITANGVKAFVVEKRVSWTSGSRCKNSRTAQLRTRVCGAPN